MKIAENKRAEKSIIKLNGRLDFHTLYIIRAQKKADKALKTGQILT